MNEFVLLLSMIPGIEAMWASAYFICSSQFVLVPITVALNFFAVFVFLRLIDRALLPERIERFLQKRLDSKVRTFERWFQGYGMIVLIALVALPFSGIGSFTGALIGRVFGLSERKVFLSEFLGIALSLGPAFLIAHGVHNIFGIS